MIAIESLAQPEERSGNALAHVAMLQSLTTGAPDLSEDDRASLLSALAGLKSVPLGPRVRKLLETRVAGRQYDGTSPLDFYRKCAATRNKVVHASNTVTERDVGHLAANLEVLVGNVLGHSLLSIDV